MQLFGWADVGGELCWEGAASDAAVLEAVGDGGVWVDEVASVEDERGAHGGAEFGEVDGGELGPFGGDDEGFGVFGSFERGGSELDFFGQRELFEFFHSFGVVSGDDGTVVDEGLDEVDGDAAADVVGIGFEADAPDGEFFVFEDPESFADAVEEALELVFVDFLNFFEEVEGGAELFSDGDEGGEVFREAGAAVADACVEEAASDAFVHADAFGDFFDVGAADFADF